MKKVLILVMLFLIIPISVDGFSPEHYTNGIFLKIDNCDDETNLNTFQFDVAVRRSEFKEVFDDPSSNYVPGYMLDTEYGDFNNNWISARRFMNSSWSGYEHYNCNFYMFEYNLAFIEMFTGFKILIYLDGELVTESSIYRTSDIPSEISDDWTGITFRYNLEDKELSTFYEDPMADGGGDFFGGLVRFMVTVLLFAYFMFFVGLETGVYWLTRQPTDGTLLTLAGNAVTALFGIIIFITRVNESLDIIYGSLLLLIAAIVQIVKMIYIRKLLPGVVGAALIMSILHVLVIFLFLTFSI